MRVSLLLGLAATVDVAPGPVRFGIGRDVRARLLSQLLASLDEEEVAIEAADASVEGALAAGVVVLATRSLGTGGVETVVATLARLLPRHDLRVVVLTSSGGGTAESLRRAGAEVAVVEDAVAAAQALSGVPRGAVAELHNAPEWLVDACHKALLRLVPVYHTTDFDLSAAGWEEQRAIAERSAASIAVSATVRAFCRSRLGGTGPEIDVVPNGVRFPPLTHGEIDHARSRLDALAGGGIADGIVFSSLVRYTLQKNVPGLVAAFLRAAEQRADIHLVVAGPVDDWVEYALAAALASANPHGHRILLLGPSHSRTLLAASDAFVLDSFFEGWPIAASEAVRAGLPLVMPDVGGASELIGPGMARGHRVANPAQAADSMTMRDIRAARRRPARQRNRDELARAILTIANDRDRWRARRQEIAARSDWLDADAMVRRHASLIATVGSGVE